MLPFAQGPSNNDPTMRDPRSATPAMSATAATATADAVSLPPADLSHAPDAAAVHAAAAVPESRADVVLREALAVMSPVARLLIANGVTYNRFAQALKQVFLDVARDELTRGHRKVTDSALSLLSGVHRKDVRAFGSNGELKPGPNRALSIASLVFTRWSTDTAWADAGGTPLALPLRTRDGAEGARAATFEALTQSVSKDFHARSVLDELLRLKLVTFDDDAVRLRPDAYAPSPEFAELLHAAGANLRSHAAASTANLRSLASGMRPPFLEHAVELEGLAPAAAGELDALARQLWKQAARRLQDAAAEHAAATPAGGNASLRVGMYFHAETQPAEHKRSG
jgi:hypothetical protein